MNDVAFLCYWPYKKRQDNNSFDGNYNIGANVIMDALRRNGINCEFCAPETAKEYKAVLVSFTSDYDCMAFYKSVCLRNDWQPGKRKFNVIGGGEGLQNPTTVRNYLDYGVFGRGEDIICDLVSCILGGGIYTHESVMRFPDIAPVKLCQSDALYPHNINLGGCRAWKETFIGCPNKCLFCHYTWSRKWIGGDTYYQGDLTMKRSVEILWKDIPKMNKKEGRIRTAIDGFSERIRYAYGKRISNQDIVDGINHIGSFEGTTVVMVYNISNMPGETQEDRDELYTTVKKANPRHRVIVVFQSTPFRPSLLTPLQWSPVTLFPATSDLSASVIYDSDNLRVMHSFSNESPWSQLQTVIISRATRDTDKLFHAICFHPRLNTGTAREKIRLLQNSFELSQYTRSYNVSETHPAWFLSSYTSLDKLKRAYTIANQRIASNTSINTHGKL
jgi:radical SAM superfamily enzyme YgiQ (UPF0313 family)